MFKLFIFLNDNKMEILALIRIVVKAEKMSEPSIDSLRRAFSCQQNAY